MGGVHVALRNTDTDVYYAAFSKLLLPAVCSCRKNSPVGSGINGAFPEFFHRFYKDGYDISAGVIYTTESNYAGEFRLFVDGKSNTTQSSHYESNRPIAVPSNKTIYLHSYYSNGKLITRAYSDEYEENIIGELEVSMKQAAYDTLSKGSVVGREICLAVNPNNSGAYDIPADCFFTTAGFTETKTKFHPTTNVRMTLDNSWTNHGKFDAGISPSTRYYVADTSELNSTYRDHAIDKCAASFNGTLY